MTKDALFLQISNELGYSFEGEILIGGNYTSVLLHGDTAYVSGQIPRVGSQIVVTGRVGDDVSLERAQLAAKICIMRALALLRNHLGGLDKVAKILKLNVYTQAADSFASQSEVADAASEILFRIFGDNGKHTRTSVGVFTLPKNAAVELDVIVATA